LITASVTAVATMSAMHEYVHQWASEQGQPNECSKDVGAVLGKQERPTDYQKPDENETCA
jgi:hypothetical protein